MAPAAQHPKGLLYAKVYIPATVNWFAKLAKSAVKDELLANAGEHGLLQTLVRLNELSQDLVEGLVTDEMAEAAHPLREAVLWMDGDWRHADEAPGPDPTVEQLRTSLVAKLRRNISLGVLEAVLCLESARRLARDKERLCGDELHRTLVGSRQLYASLAVLHDLQERERLSFLTGIPGYLEYPAYDFHHVVSGELSIPPDKFVVTETPDGLRIRFGAPKLGRVDEAADGPIMRCPAHRPSAAEPDSTYNDVLWDLLIDLYDRAGCFG